MIPDADIVALSGSVSNHWSRKSAALIVMSPMNAACCRSGRRAKSRPSPSTPSQSRGSTLVGSGGTMPRIGLMKRAMSAISWPYSSYASASVADQRRISRIVAAWSSRRHRKSPWSGVNVPSSGRISRPCFASSRSRMISGRSRLTT